LKLFLFNAIFCKDFGAIKTVNPITILGYKGKTPVEPQMGVINQEVVRQKLEQQKIVQ
jgi:hypothetical protein